MILLSIDVGAKTGYSVFRGGLLLESGVKKFAFTEDYGWRNFKKFILDICHQHKVAAVVYEEPPLYLKGGASVNLLKYCGALVLTVVDLLRLPVYSIGPTKVKKFITGKGNATKAEVVTAISEVFNYEFTSEDEADSIAVGVTFLLDYLAENQEDNEDKSTEKESDNNGDKPKGPDTRRSRRKKGGGE